MAYCWVSIIKGLINSSHQDVLNGIKLKEFSLNPLKLGKLLKTKNPQMLLCPPASIIKAMNSPFSELKSGGPQYSRDNLKAGFVHHQTMIFKTISCSE